MNDKCLKLFMLGVFLAINSDVVFSVIDRERYEYLLYENFERTKLLNIEEQIYIKKLKHLRFELSHIRDTINSTLGQLNHLVYKRHIARLLKMYVIIRLIKYTEELIAFKRSIVHTKYQYSFRNIEKSISDYGSVEDIMSGAKKGLLALRQTYSLNVTNFSKGIVQFKNKRPDRSRAADTLQPDDLVSLAAMAFNLFHWFDSALLFLRVALNFLKNNAANKMKNLHVCKIGSSMNKLYSEYITLHNKLLLDKKVHVGPAWILFPFIIENGSPLFIKSIQILSYKYIIF